MAVKKGRLVLCIDRDNDLFEKAKVSGPIVGREANLNAAIKLALADPTDTDSNTIFRAVVLADGEEIGVKATNAKNTISGLKTPPH